MNLTSLEESHYSMMKEVIGNVTRYFQNQKISVYLFF